MLLTEDDNVFQILTPEGEVTGKVPALDDSEFVRLYRWMVFGRIFSDRMVALQRQGRMGTFAPAKRTGSDLCWYGCAPPAARLANGQLP
jgi:TPP-dependent pyruvate/acetoin dehydrogenase alpha subunit